MSKENPNFIPLAEMITFLEADKFRIYNIIRNDKKVNEFLRVTEKNNRKKYYISLNFVDYYRKLEQEKILSEDEIETFREIYYQYVDCEEKIIFDSGKSIATENALWKDMEILDADIVRKCISKYKDLKDLEKVPTHIKNLIRDAVYRHVFTNKTIFNIVNSVVVEKDKRCKE